MSAIVITCALATIHTAPAVAQTATELDCKDCIKSKHIKDGKIKGKDLKDETVSNAKIEDGAVDSSKIEDSSVANVDLSGDAVTSDKIADGTVDTPDLAGSAVTGGKIATGAVNSSKVQNNSLTGSDIAGDSVSVAKLSNEAGANFVGTQQNFVLSSTPTSVRDVTITAPTSGIAIVNASGFYEFIAVTFDPGDARCSITTVSTTVDVSHAIRAEMEANHDGFMPFGATRGFNVSSGSTTFYLVCKELEGDVRLGDSHLTVMFFPTAY